MANSFDVCDYLLSESKREITIAIQGKQLTISEERFGNTDIWIVPSAELERALQERFRAFYPMFLGVLLTSLHESGAHTPIRCVYLEDLDRAFERGDLQGLADSIAAGSYRSGNLS